MDSVCATDADEIFAIIADAIGRLCTRLFVGARFAVGPSAVCACFVAIFLAIVAVYALLLKVTNLAIFAPKMSAGSVGAGDTVPGGIANAIGFVGFFAFLSCWRLLVSGLILGIAFVLNAIVLICLHVLMIWRWFNGADSVALVRLAVVVFLFFDLEASLCVDRYTVAVGATPLNAFVVLATLPIGLARCAVAGAVTLEFAAVAAWFVGFLRRDDAYAFAARIVGARGFVCAVCLFGTRLLKCVDAGWATSDEDDLNQEECAEVTRLANERPRARSRCCRFMLHNRYHGAVKTTPAWFLPTAMSAFSSVFGFVAHATSA